MRLLCATFNYNIESFFEKCNPSFYSEYNFGVLLIYYCIILLDFAKRVGVKGMKTVAKETIAKEFGQFIREAREKEGLYQADLAEQLGLSRSYYTLIEAGEREIYFSLAINICRVLNLDIGDFAKHLK
jgi:DNA-binding XRE family transcriptional regulator